MEAEEKSLEIDEKNLKEILTNSILEPNLVNIWEDEINFISLFLETYKLSPTDLNKFLEDPKKFLREVVFRYPFLSNENLVFWTIYHRVLEIAYREKTDKVLALKKLKSLFLEELEKYNLTAEEKERLKERWISWLEWYYEIYKNNTRETIKTEYNFRGKNIVFEDIPLTWKIDKIELIPHPNPLLKGEGVEQDFSNVEVGSGSQIALFTEKVALVDYKTWSIKSNSIIKWIDRYWNKKSWPTDWAYARQLLFYKLMFENNFELNSKYSISELALDFVEGKNWEYRYTPVSFTNEEYEDFKNELREAWEKINDLEFWREVLKK